ncbi:MAG TPA: TIGR03619 family F420-dependent LLM class oxidoreductase [Acidimicrobiales bacterium]|nr:TIGR03619 family F420-dependent LLM class oxidoreductase [Acidimicrobiales bacterium]
MKVSLGLPTYNVDLAHEFGSAPAIAAVARAAEAAGFDACFSDDHPIPGEDAFAFGSHHSYDLLVVLSMVAAVTERLRLHTNLLILPFRNPFLSAKGIATLDACSGGRVICGVGVGYGATEFAALGVDFAERNELCDEAIDVMKAVWTGDTLTLTGRHFDVPANSARPVPAQTPHPPIWIGGNSKQAIRRAVERADGWSPFPNPAEGAAERRTPVIDTVDALRRRIDYARAHAEAVGRTDPLEIVFMPLGSGGQKLDMWTSELPTAPWVVDSAAELREAGVTYLAVTLPGQTLDEFTDQVAWFGSEVLPEVEKL